MEIKDYIQPLLRWWWLIVLAVALSTGASYYVVAQQPPSYVATATLAVGQILSNPDPSGTQISLAQQLASAYVDLATRPIVVDATKDALGLERLPPYRATLGTQNRLLIEITVTDTEPNRAAAVANTVAEQLISQTPTGSIQAEVADRQEFISRELDEIQLQIDSTRTELEQKRSEFANAVSAVEIQTIGQDINALENKLISLQNTFTDLLSGIETAPANTIEFLIRATPPSRDSGPPAQLTVTIAALIGAVLAGGAAYLLSYLDDSIKTPEDVQRVVRLNTLAGIIRFRKPDQQQLVAATDPRTPAAEAFRGLRTAAQFATIDAEYPSYLITSARPNEGKTTVAANLAITLAQAEHRTLLIDADLRRPSQHDLFALPNSFGLTNLLLQLKPNDPQFATAAQTLISEYAQTVSTDNLHVLTSGPMPHNPAELLGSVKMKKLLEALSQRYDSIVIDCAPALAATDSIVLSQQVAGVIVVVEANRTRRPQLRQVVKHLQDVSAPVIGVVLNRISGRSGSGYLYYYNYAETYFDNAREPEALATKVNGKGARRRNGRERHSNGKAKPRTDEVRPDEKREGA